MLYIEYVCGDILNSKDEFIVNPVNRNGIMGAGLAKQIKENFHNSYKHYRMVLVNDSNRNIHPGDIIVSPEDKGVRIIHALTKGNYNFPSRPEYVSKCMYNICKYLCSLDRDTSISIPLLGAGCGGLDPLLSQGIISASCIKMLKKDKHTFNVRVYVHYDARQRNIG